MGRFQQSKSLLLSVDRMYLKTEVLFPIFNTNTRNHCIMIPWPFFLVLHVYTNCVYWCQSLLIKWISSKDDTNLSMVHLNLLFPIYFQRVKQSDFIFFIKILQNLLECGTSELRSACKRNWRFWGRPVADCVDRQSACLPIQVSPPP